MLCTSVCSAFANGHTANKWPIGLWCANFKRAVRRTRLWLQEFFALYANFSTANTIEKDGDECIVCFLTDHSFSIHTCKVFRVAVLLCCPNTWITLASRKTSYEHFTTSTKSKAKTTKLDACVYSSLPSSLSNGICPSCKPWNRNERNQRRIMNILSPRRLFQWQFSLGRLRNKSFCFMKRLAGQL